MLPSINWSCSVCYGYNEKVTGWLLYTDRDFLHFLLRDYYYYLNNIILWLHSKVFDWIWDILVITPKSPSYECPWVTLDLHERAWNLLGNHKTVVNQVMSIRVTAMRCTGVSTSITPTWLGTISEILPVESIVCVCIWIMMIFKRLRKTFEWVASELVICILTSSRDITKTGYCPHEYFAVQKFLCPFMVPHFHQGVGFFVVWYWIFWHCIPVYDSCG